jgi:hypothetical protein
LKLLERLLLLVEQQHVGNFKTGFPHRFLDGLEDHAI